jgi:ribosomal protein L24E
MNKEHCIFTNQRECHYCKAIIQKGFMHIPNRYLTYYFCDEKCFELEYGSHRQENET